MFLRISISLILGLAMSFGLIVVGKRLGDMLPEAPEESSGSDPSEDRENFVYKAIEPASGGEASFFSKLSENDFDFLSVRISDSDGKLKYLTDINSILYSSGISTSLKPLSAVIKDAKSYGKSVSVDFSLFESDKGQETADICSIAILRLLASFDTDEAVIHIGDRSASELSDIIELSKSKMKLGAILTYSAITSEIALREYYSAFDFLVLDLTSLSAEKGTPNDDGTTEAPSIREFLGENGVILKKYSIRLRVGAKGSDDAEELVALFKEFNIDSYELYEK